MKVLCRRIFSPNGKDLGDESPWLKVGGEYIVLAIMFLEKSGLQIYIQTEHHDEPHFFNLIGFEFLDQKVPASWVTVIHEAYDRKVITMLPASWNYEGFFDDMENQDPKAIELYNKEVEVIYREEGII